VAAQVVYVADMQAAANERRRGTRGNYTVDVSVTVMPAFDNETSRSRTVLGRTVNLGDAGICIRADEPLESAALVLCKIALPFSHINVPTLMQVRWVHKGIREQAGYYFAGLQFLL